MLDTLIDIITQEIQYGIKRALRPVAPYLRKIGTGFVVLMLSAFLWALSLFALAVALFCKLSGLLLYTGPALYVCLAAALGGIFLVTVGSGLMRRPR